LITCDNADDVELMNEGIEPAICTQGF